MKIAVTGAAGRVGRATLQELKDAAWVSRTAGNGDAGVRRTHAEGHTVWALDRTLPPSGLAQRSLLVDLSDAGAVYGSLAGADAVIHLGAYPSTAHHPGEQVFANNTAASANVAAACTALGITRVVYASSITVYGLDWQARNGGLTKLPADESTPKRPDDFYALSKWVGEEIFTLAAQEHGLHVASLRIALVVGPDEYDRRGQPRDQQDASAGLWAYVDSRDVAQAARLAAERLDDLGPGNHPFNIAAADPHSRLPLSQVIPAFIPDLAPLCTHLTNPDDTAYSIAKARSQLGYTPKHSWRDIITS